MSCQMQGDESIAAGNFTTELFDAGEKFLFMEYQQKDKAASIIHHQGQQSPHHHSSCSKPHLFVFMSIQSSHRLSSRVFTFCDLNVTDSIKLNIIPVAQCCHYFGLAL